MKTTAKKTVSQETVPTLEFKRTLLPIDEFAAREGVSQGIVQECGKLGIIRIRKHGGKTFVLDMPAGPYSETPETSAEATQPTDRATLAQKISEFVQKSIPTSDRMPDRPNRSAVDSAKVKLGSISRFFKKMLSRAPRADDTAKPPKRAGKEARQGQSRGEPARNIRPVATNKAQPVTDKKPRESMPSQVEPKDDKAHRQIADRTAFAKDVIKRIEETAPPRRPSSVEAHPKTEESSRSATLSSDTQPSSKAAKTDSSGSSPRINEPSIVDKPSEKQKTEPPAQAPTLQVTEISEESPKLAQVLHDNWLQFGVLGAQAQSRRNWQTATVLSLVLLLLAFCTSLWLYTDRKIQASELERTYLNTQNIYSSLGEATKQNRIIQHELESSKAQTARLQGQLQGFKAEIERLQNELENSRTQLKAAENELRESGKEVADTRSSDLETLDRLAARIRKLASWLGQQSANQQTPSGSDNSPN